MCNLPNFFPSAFWHIPFFFRVVSELSMVLKFIGNDSFTYFKFQNTDKPSKHKSRKMTRRPLILFQKQHCFSQGSWCHLFVMLKAVTSLNPFPFLLGWGAYYLFKQSPKRLRSLLVIAVVGLMVHQQPQPRSQRNLRFGEFSQQVSCEQ